MHDVITYLSDLLRIRPTLEVNANLQLLFLHLCPC